MEMNHMDLLIVIVLSSENFCKHKLNNVLKQLLKICSGTDKIIFCFGRYMISFDDLNKFFTYSFIFGCILLLRPNKKKNKKNKKLPKCSRKISSLYIYF